jgi:Flp pilus assembly protein TadG
MLGSLKRRLPRDKRRRGTVIILFSIMLMMVVLPIVGLSIDGAVLYLVRAKLSAACDAAALAGGRSVNNGTTFSTQVANAETIMNSYFYANFPNGLWRTRNTQLSLNVQYTATHTRTTTVSATVTVPLYFMSIIGKSSSNVSAYAQTTRKDLFMMLVLDRSQSMATAGVCGQMVTDARNFVSQFTNGTDQVGLLTFMDGANVDYVPTVNFKTQTPSLDTTLSQLQCGGNTASAEALSIAGSILTQNYMQGGFNVIVFFTDGNANSLAFNLGGSGSSVLPLKTQADTRYGSGTYSDSVDTGPYPYPDPTQLYSMPATTCSVGSASVGTLSQNAGNNTLGYSSGMFYPIAPAISNGTSTMVSGMSNCYWTTNRYNIRQDFAYIPAQDYYGNSTSGYLPDITFTSGVYSGHIRIDEPAAIANASANAFDNQAQSIRNKTSYPVTIFTIGLGGTVVWPLNTVLLQRVANDPNSPIYDSTKPTGAFIYAPTITQLQDAYLQVQSQILRLSQ